MAYDLREPARRADSVTDRATTKRHPRKEPAAPPALERREAILCGQAAGRLPTQDQSKGFLRVSAGGLSVVVRSNLLETRRVAGSIP